MADLDDTVVFDASSVTDTASQPSSFATNYSTGGSSAFSLLRKARSVADQLRDINHNDVPEDAKLMPKILIGGESFVLESWGSNKRKKKSVINKYGVRLIKVDEEGNKMGV
ncbi:hypothetical protein QBC37DRAFT_377036 [Rhypophila decipiens]|uniref:Uncharacterized protein n=1 Tax=Rhypophila decipiens TaxID=261697 RepID=A0AAN7B713_9PEZI|nr:hypothetical protein QBC37DRAFT_377036 [Rhypophila decipiens]